MVDTDIRDEHRVRPRFCPRCGHELLRVGSYCSQCALPIPEEERQYEDYGVSPRSRTVALILCALLGYLGVHRFYVGKIGSGLIWLCTGGLFGIGWVIDLVVIALGTFRDIDGLLVEDWE